jgi:hypothetical protein
MKLPIRLLVCGSTDFSNQKHMNTVLNKFKRSNNITLVIHRGSAGADRLADLWARSKGIPVKEYKANWREYGKTAGPIRNYEMLKDGKPTVVFAFSSDKGTESIIEKAEKKGIHIVRF